jgi:hypothetical protein
MVDALTPFYFEARSVQASPFPFMKWRFLHLG